MKRRGFGRAQPKRELGRRVLIACEGRETEPGYFAEIVRARRLSTVQVRILPHSGTDPKNIVLAVAQEVRQEQKVGGWGVGDTAWAAFDGDEHFQGNWTNWNDAMQIARDRKIGLVISNPSFEFWYLLHFRDHFAQLTRDAAFALLTEHLPRYKKSERLYVSHLQPLTNKAIERARILASHAQNKGLLSHQNPCCGGVADLVESLLELESVGSR